MAVGMIILLVGVVGEVMAMEVIFSVGEVGEGRMVEDVIGEGVSFCEVLDKQKEKNRRNKSNYWKWKRRIILCSDLGGHS
jgi:hypothetical protein